MITLYRFILVILKPIRKFQMSLENKVYLYKIHTFGISPIEFSSNENNHMRKVVETLSKENKRNPRSHTLDENIKKNRVKFNESARRVFDKEITQKEFHDTMRSIDDLLDELNKMKI